MQVYVLRVAVDLKHDSSKTCKFECNSGDKTTRGVEEREGLFRSLNIK